MNRRDPAEPLIHLRPPPPPAVTAYGWCRRPLNVPKVVGQILLGGDLDEAALEAIPHPPTNGDSRRFCRDDNSVRAKLWAIKRLDGTVREDKMPVNETDCQGTVADEISVDGITAEFHQWWKMNRIVRLAVIFSCAGIPMARVSAKVKVSEVTPPSNTILLDFGNNVYDYYVNSSFQIQGLDPTKAYSLTFFGSHKYSASDYTTYSICSDASYSRVVTSISLYVQSPGNPGAHNSNKVATISRISPQNNGIMYIKFRGTNRDATVGGYLNCMQIVEITPTNTPPPPPKLGNSVK